MHNQWSIDRGLSLDSALSEWEAQSAIGRQPKTIEYNQRLARIIRDRWRPALTTPCEGITAAAVTQFAAAIDHYSPSQFNHLVNVIRALVPAGKILRRKQERPKIADLPTEDRYRALLGELDRGRSPIAGQLVRLLAFTGMRISEACALTAADVLPHGLLIRVSKTRAGRRVIPYVGECRQIVDDLLTKKNGSPTLVPVKSVRRALVLACRRAGVPRLSHHDFRRLFATRCIESGVPIQAAARWLGHSDGGALLGKTYFHLIDEHSLALAAKVKI